MFERYIPRALKRPARAADSFDRRFGGGMLAAVEDDVDGDASRAREAIDVLGLMGLISLDH